MHLRICPHCALSQSLFVLQHSRQTPVEETMWKVPLFRSDLTLDNLHLDFDPSLDEFHEKIMKVLISFKDCTLAFPNLTPDRYFHSFTR